MKLASMPFAVPVKATSDELFMSGAVKNTMEAEAGHLQKLKAVMEIGA